MNIPIYASQIYGIYGLCVQLVGMFVCGIFMAITCEVDVVIGCDLTFI